MLAFQNLTWRTIKCSLRIHFYRVELLDLSIIVIIGIKHYVEKINSVTTAKVYYHTILLYDSNKCNIVH